MKSKSLVLLLASMLALTGCAGAGENPEGGGTTPEEQHEKESEIVLVSISVKTQPTKKEYKEGETFDPTGMVVEATYSDGTTKEVTNYQISNQALTVSTTSINILYEGKTAQVDITVNPLPTYVVTFMASESEKIEDVTYKEGATPSYSYSVPSTAQYEYEFLGWSLTPNGDVLSELPKVTQNATYYAKIQQKTRKYSIIFKNEAGSVLQNSEVEYGTKPVAPEYNPTDTAQYDYSFVGWATSQGGEVLASLPEVTGAATYFAIVSSTVRSYTIKFVDEGGNEIQSNTLEYGATPTCDYEVEDTAEWDYTTKWSKTADGSAIASFPTVTGNATYFAVVTKVKQKYDITFKNEDGSAYKTVNVEYGSVPSVTSPTKAADQQYTYAFAGWSTTKGGEVLTSLPSVTGEATYYAIFKGTLNKYKLTLDLNYEDCEEASFSADYGTQIDDEDLESYVPEREGYHFAGWCSDSACKEKVTFPITLTEDATLYAKWNEKIEISKYLKALLGVKDFDPYSFIPETLRPDYEANFIESTDLLDYSETQSVSDIKTQGFGEQWEMVVENLIESERFYKVLTVSDSIFTAALTAFINYFEDNAHAEETNHEEQKADNYDASCSYKDGVLTFSLEFKKSVLGFSPKIEMVYAVATAEKVIKISLNELNVLKCIFTEDQYTFGISYGIPVGEKTGIRTAFCVLNKSVDEDDEENVSYEGHIYEYISYMSDEKTTNLIKSSADFYIDDKYCSVIGNKASGLVGSDAMINELYDVKTGRLYGYMVEENIEKWLMNVTYHTFFFNLCDINNIFTVKAVPNGKVDPTDNHSDVYVNGSKEIFAPEHNGTKLFPTSRKYDIELRDHYNYGLDKDEKLVKYEAQIPMMFIQDDDVYHTDKYNNTDFTDFSSDMVKSGVNNAFVTLENLVIEKIREDCINLGPVYKENKDFITPETIIAWLAE